MPNYGSFFDLRPGLNVDVNGAPGDFDEGMLTDAFANVRDAEFVFQDKPAPSAVRFASFLCVVGLTSGADCETGMGGISKNCKKQFGGRGKTISFELDRAGERWSHVSCCEFPMFLSLRFDLPANFSTLHEEP
jgi:hypothetical protein